MRMSIIENNAATPVNLTNILANTYLSGTASSEKLITKPKTRPRNCGSISVWMKFLYPFYFFNLLDRHHEELILCHFSSYSSRYN